MPTAAALFLDYMVIGFCKQNHNSEGVHFIYMSLQVLRCISWMWRSGLHSGGSPLACSAPLCPRTSPLFPSSLDSARQACRCNMPATVLTFLLFPLQYYWALIWNVFCRDDLAQGPGIPSGHSQSGDQSKVMQAARVKSSQFLFLNVPAVSWFDWHPISIASVTPAADGQCQDVVLHLKALGAWSRVSHRHHCACACSNRRLIQDALSI